MKVGKDGGRTTAATAAAYRDRDWSRGGSAAVVPFFDHSVVGAGIECKQRIERGAWRGVGEHSGGGIDSHGGNALGAGRSRRRHKLHRRTHRAVGLRGGHSDLPTAAGTTHRDG